MKFDEKIIDKETIFQSNTIKKISITIFIKNVKTNNIIIKIIKFN
jgi:hypothetical protein